jgi:hypothetical protein
MMRVHTLTLNPAIDETITLDALVPGQVHRARGVRQNAGGKGINVASCLADWGVPVSAHGLLGRDNAAPFEALFAAKPITDAMVRVDGATRVNLKLVDAHDTTDINLDGLAVTDETLATVLDGLAASAAPGDMVVLAGSLPGCPPDCYATLVARLRGQGAHVLLDASGDPLTRALAAPVLPHVIKPNRDELAAWAGSRWPTWPRCWPPRALQARGWPKWWCRWAAKARCSSTATARCMRGCRCHRWGPWAWPARWARAMPWSRALPPPMSPGWALRKPRGSPPPLPWPSWAWPGRTCPNAAGWKPWRKTSFSARARNARQQTEAWDRGRP